MNNSSGRTYLIFTHEFFPHSGGIATYNWELAQALTNGGFKVTVLTSEQSRREMCLHPFPVRYIHYPRFLRPLTKWRMRIFFSIIGLLWTVLKVNPDIILATSGEAHICVGLMSQLLRVKYVLVVHGSEVLDYFSSPQIGSVLKGAMKRVYRKAMAIVAVSYSTQRLIERKLPELVDRVHVVQNGISFPEVVRRDVEKIRFLKEQLHLTEADSVLLTVSRLAPGKGHDYVLRALSIARKHIPNLKYVIAGIGPCFEELKKIVLEEKLEKNVLFLGEIPRERVWDFYRICDVFILPSRRGDREAFPICCIEAAATGKPVIVGNQGGMGEFVDEGKTGLLVDSESVGKIADAIVFIFKNPETSQEMGENARKRYQESFTAEIMTRRLLQIIEKNAS